MIPQCVLICISLMISDIEHLFIGHLYVLFGEMSIQVLCSFFNWVVWFFLVLSLFSFNLFLKKDFIYLLLERGEGREKERERNINV